MTKTLKPTPNSVYIMTATFARAAQIKQILALRGFDEIFCVSDDAATTVLKTSTPSLCIIDMEGNKARVEALMALMSPQTKTLILHPAFDEALFLLCHDHGARDYMVTPVPDAYLVSRVIRALQENRVEQLAQQKDRVLVEMGALSPRSGVFTTSHTIQLLKKQVEQTTAPNDLSLLVLRLQGFDSPLPETYENPLLGTVAQVLKECSRGLDVVGEYFVDKFIVILPNTGIRGANALAERLKSRLQSLTVLGPAGPFDLQISVGVAESTGIRHYEDLLIQALHALDATPVTSR